jgi:hypothetical protein
VAENAGDRGERGSGRAGIFKRRKMAIDDNISLVRPIVRTDHRSGIHVRQHAQDIGLREGQHLDRQLGGTDPLDPLRSVGDHDHPCRGCGDDLLAQHRAPCPLDRKTPRVDLVRAVDRQVDLRDIGEVEDVDPDFAGQHAAGFGGDDGTDLKPLSYAFAKRPDRECRG